MNLLIALIIGAFVGWLAGQMAGREQGILGSMVIGVVGSFIGSFISMLFTGADRSFLAFSWTGLFWSFLGALVLVFILNAVQHHPANR